MALFVVLMRPFLEKASIIYLPSVWESVKRGPHLSFSDVEIRSIDRALENVNKGAIAVSKDGVKIGRDEFYRILGDGTFFGSVEEASAQLREMEGLMLRSIAWFQFLTFNVDVFPIVAAIARRIVKSRRTNPLKAEIKALCPSSPKCLYCLATAAKFTSEEHVYPESLAPEYLVSDLPVLPIGVVCDRCNNGILSDLDKALMDFGPIALVRVQLTLFSKRGRMPLARFGDITVRKVRPRVLRFERGGKLVDPLEVGSLRADIRSAALRKLARALYKVGLGMFAFKAGLGRALSSDFDAARAFVLHDEPFKNDFIMNPSFTFEGQIRFEYRDDEEQGTPVGLRLFGKGFAFNLRESPRIPLPYGLPGVENLIVVPLDQAAAGRGRKPRTATR